MMSQYQRSLQLFFVLSISSVMSCKSSSSKIPESLITADTASGPNGYAESRHVAEYRLFMHLRNLDCFAQSLVQAKKPALLTLLGFGALTNGFPV